MKNNYSEIILPEIEEINIFLSSLTKEELEDYIKACTGEPCDPETCQGQCQGAGGCEICEDFRNNSNND